tara:strand:- start:154 stop:369 length:216 start_codon:yes stop_codon:yes gene_type:complete
VVVLVVDHGFQVVPHKREVLEQLIQIIQKLLVILVVELPVALRPKRWVVVVALVAQALLLQDTLVVLVELV